MVLPPAGRAPALACGGGAAGGGWLALAGVGIPTMVRWRLPLRGTVGEGLAPGGLGAWFDPALGAGPAPALAPRGGDAIGGASAVMPIIVALAVGGRAVPAA
jgi:hypothetical protein